MMKQYTDLLWHKLLKRPYRLARTVDAGEGTPVVFLHGLGSSGAIWKRLSSLLAGLPCRMIAFDLLGFGNSPKPGWPNYSVDDHAWAVIASLDNLKLREPIVLVGHSMGCLVAVHVARLRPQLVKRLILYEMPLYEGLPESRRYQLRRDFYYRLYNRVLQYPDFSAANVRTIQKLAARFVGFEVSKEGWTPFVRSLQNTVLRQTTLTDLKRLQVPTEIIYGSLDVVVIRGKPKAVFGADAAHINTHIITDVHGVSARASRFLAARIAEALGLELQQPKRRRTAIKKKASKR
jgi:pimeloyl-ACP methyl ester carboxylesterase